MRFAKEYKAIRYCTKCGHEFEGEYRRDCPACGGKLDTTFQDITPFEGIISIRTNCIKCGKEKPKLKIQCADGSVFYEDDKTQDRCPVCGGVWHTYIDY